MSEVSIFVAKLNDRALIEAFESVHAAFPDELTIQFTSQFGVVSPEAIGEFIDMAGLALVSASLSMGQHSWTWYRLGPATATTYPQSAEYDRVAYFRHQVRGVAGEPAPLAPRVDNALKLALSRPLTVVDDDSPLNLATGREVLLALQTTSQRLLTETAEHRSKLEVEFAAREAERESRFDEMRQLDQERLNQEREAAQAAHVERVAALDARQSDLDTLQKTLDDRNNTHVRREIRSSLLELTKERLLNFRVSPETRKQYILVHILCLLGIAALMSITVLTAVRFDAGLPQASLIISAARSVLAGAAAVALGVWYLKWLNRWLQRIADAEFKLQQFRLDIERASWLAETVLEWKQSSSEPFPELLAGRLSAGLFQSSRDDIDDPQAPATQLAEALLGSAASAKLRLGEQELSLDRKGLRQLERAEAK